MSTNDYLGEDIACKIRVKYGKIGEDAVEYALSLLDPEPWHVVQFTDDGYVIKHPLACRANGLFSCPLNSSHIEYTDMRGRYVILPTEDGGYELGDRVDA